MEIRSDGDGPRAERRRYAPMLATAAEPDGVPRDWIEIKWDGYRCLAYLDAASTLLLSRSRRDLGPSFPELAELHRAVSAAAVLDGEVVAFEGDRPSFSRLQSRLGLEPKARESAPAAIAFIAFDLLEYDGEGLLDRPLRARRARLEEALTGAPEENTKQAGRLQLSPVFGGIPAQLLARAAEWGLEGIVVKDPDSPYRPGRRTTYWRKMKRTRKMTPWVVGFTARGRSVRSLLLGDSVPDGGLAYIGRVGTGFTDRERREWHEGLVPLVRAEPALTAIPADAPADAVWVEPAFRCRIAYLEWTAAGRLRHPVYLGPAEDEKGVVLPGDATLPAALRGKGGGT